MTGLDKAKRLVERLAAEGKAPTEVALTLYRDAAQYHLHHSGEDYAEHLDQRQEFVKWLGQRGIAVVDASVTATVPTKTADLAAQAVRPSYRIGLYLAHPQPGQGVVGWAAIGLQKMEGGEE